MKISIGNDAGPDYKKAIVKMLDAKGYEVTNYGTDTEESVDYPDFAHPVASDVAEGKGLWNCYLRKRQRNCNDC
jgi:ribose 5-phosphate isomerase B